MSVSDLSLGSARVSPQSMGCGVRGVFGVSSDISHEDDIADIECIDSRREHLRTREDRWDSLVIVLKSLEVGSPYFLLI